MRAFARRLVRPRVRQLLLAAVAIGGVGAALFLEAELLLAVWRARLLSPPGALLVEDRSGRFLGELGAAPDGEIGYWPLKALPSRVVAATLALEDRRFGWHPGIDPVAVVRAAWQNLSGGRRVSGASTLAMQVARMQHPGPRSLTRKVNEALTAWLLTEAYGREAILRQYLRLVPYGNRIHGIAYAARRYLDKPVEDLSWAEIAFLAAIPQSPKRMNPYRPDGYSRAVERGRRVLGTLAADGVLSAEEYRVAAEQITAIQVPWLERRPPEALHALMRVGREIESERHAGGGVVRSTLDLELQKEATWITYQSLGVWAARGAGNAALLVLDAHTAEVLAYVGSADYFDAERAGAIDYAQISRSAGSTLKPFLYGLALDRGVITPATVLDDLGRAAGGITNSDGRFLGPLLPRVALANSRNVPAVELLGRLGLPQGYDFFRRLGLHDGEQSPGRFGLGLAIGGLPVTLEQLAHAYTALAGGDGELRALRFHQEQPTAEPRAVLSEASTRQIARFLSDPLARLPSFPRMGISEFPFPVAIKTGTSSGFRDAWAAAWSSRVLVVAWVGNPEYRPMNRLSGYRSAAELVQRVLLRVHRDQIGGLDDLAFPPPRGANEVRVCALTGQRATAACDHVFLESFPAGSEPMTDCAAHRLRFIDRRTGALATRATPAGERELRTFVELPPRYAEWLASTALPREPRAAGDTPPPDDRHPPIATRATRLRITSPEDGTVLLRDPETPAGLATLALSAVVDPPAPQVVWYVDGRPFEVADRPWTARWPIAPGEHTFQVRLPYSSLVSTPVRVRVE